MVGATLFLAVVLVVLYSTVSRFRGLVAGFKGDTISTIVKKVRIGY